MLPNNPEAVLAEPPARYTWDEKLRKLLPSKDDPYSYDKLSKAETDAFVEARGDGFGYPIDPRCQPFPLPSNVRSGLLDHQFYCQPGSYDEDGGNLVPWSNANGDVVSPYELFPLGFNPRRLRIYFQNQFERFYKQLSRDDPEMEKKKKWVLEERAMNQLYKKAWYEAHALQLLNLTDCSKPHFGLLCNNVTFAGQLGRLVEQYYWRFRFEPDAMTGAGARKGASAGGRAKAMKLRAQHSEWQKAAREIWARRPELGNNAVAQAIKNQFGLLHTVRHIARYIAPRL
jgi:hypothetical protein